MIVLFCYFILFLADSSHQQQHQSIASLSRLDTVEIENFKYQIDIDRIVKPAKISSFSLNEVNEKNTAENIKKKDVLSLKNIHGQSYECYLPEGLGDDSDKEEEQLDKKDSGRNSQFNFTLINEKIKKFSESMKNSQICLYKVSHMKYQKIMHYFLYFFHFIKLIK